MKDDRATTNKRRTRIVQVYSIYFCSYQLPKKAYSTL